MKIIIDSRESETLIGSFKRKELDFEIKALSIGDFQCVEKPQICIEHKTIVDLINSFRSGHIQKQLFQMETNFTQNYLIVNGSWSQTARFGATKFTINQMIGILASLAVRYNIKMIHVETNAQVALLVNAIFEKVDDGKIITIRDTELLRNTVSTEDIHIKVLTSFHGIGFKKAAKLLEKEEIKKKVEELVLLINNG